MLYENEEVFEDTLKALGRSKNTIRAYISDLTSLFNNIDVLDEANIQKYVLDLSKKGASPSSIRRAMYALRTYCSLFDIRINFTKIIRPKLVKREAEYITDSVFSQGIKNILEGTHKDRYTAVFKCAIFEILYNTGIRVNELLNLTNSSYNRDQNYLEIIGKGNKQRKIPVSGTLIEILCDDSFFKLLEKLSVGTVGYWTKKYFGSLYTPHSFRHGYTTKLIKNGAKEITVQRVLGHESFTTTLRYVHMNMGEIKKDVEKALNKEETDV